MQTQKAFAIGLLTGREHAEAAEILASARKTARKVSLAAWLPSV
jgi:hypothetical protein